MSNPPPWRPDAEQAYGIGMMLGFGLGLFIGAVVTTAAESRELMEGADA